GARDKLGSRAPDSRFHCLNLTSAFKKSPRLNRLTHFGCASSLHGAVTTRMAIAKKSCDMLLPNCVKQPRAQESFEPGSRRVRSRDRFAGVAKRRYRTSMNIWRLLLATFFCAAAALP